MYTNENVIDIIRGAIDVLNNNKWTRHSYARDSGNEKVTAEASSAQSFCATGAIQRFIHENNMEHRGFPGYKAIQELSNYVNKKGLGTDIVCYNDYFAKRKRDVVSIMKKCIKELEKKA